MIIRFSALLV